MDDREISGRTTPTVGAVVVRNEALGRRLAESAMQARNIADRLSGPVPQDSTGRAPVGSDTTKHALLVQLDRSQDTIASQIDTLQYELNRLDRVVHDNPPGVETSGQLRRVG